MRARLAALSFSVFLGGAVSQAQTAPQAAPVIPQIDYNLVNCSGFVTDQKVPDEIRSEEHTSELQSQSNLVCRLLLEKKKKQGYAHSTRYRKITRYPSRKPRAKD